MARPWKEILDDSAYAALSTEEKSALHNLYFKTVIAPEMPKDSIGAARDQFDEFTRSYLQPQAAPEPQKDPGFISNIVNLAKSGYESSAEGVKAQIGGDESLPGLIAQRATRTANEYQPPQLQEAKYAFKDEAATLDEGGAWNTTKGIAGIVAEIGKQVLTNPKGVAYLGAEQAANMAAIIAGRYPGAVAGGMAGGATPLPGGAAVGAFFGGAATGGVAEYALEAGNATMEGVTKRAQAAGVDVKDENALREFLQSNPQALEESKIEGAKKGFWTALVDQAMMGVSGRIASAPARAAQKEAAAQIVGTNVSLLADKAIAKTVADKADEILKATSLASRAKQLGLATGNEMIGGMGSEAAGQYAAYDNLDWNEIALEGLGEVVTGPVEAMAVGREYMRDTRTLRNIPQQSDPADTATKVLSTPETGDLNQDVDATIAAFEGVLTGDALPAAELLDPAPQGLLSAGVSLPRTGYGQAAPAAYQYQEQLNVIQPPAENTQADLRDQVQAGVDVRLATGTGGIAAPESMGLAAVGDGLASIGAQPGGLSASAYAQPAGRAGGETVANQGNIANQPAQSTEIPKTAELVGENTPISAQSSQSARNPNRAVISTAENGKTISVSARGIPPAIFGAKFENEARAYYEGLKSAQDPQAFVAEWQAKVQADTKSAMETQSPPQPETQQPQTPAPAGVSVSDHTLFNGIPSNNVNQAIEPHVLALSKFTGKGKQNTIKPGAYAAIMGKAREAYKTGSGDAAYFSRQSKLFKKDSEIRAALEGIASALSDTPASTAPSAPSQAMPFSLGRAPNASQPITVKNGVIHIGDSPAMNYDTGEDVTIHEGATQAEIRQVLQASGAVPNGHKFYGADKEVAPEIKAATENGKKSRLIPQSRMVAMTDSRLAIEFNRAELERMKGELGWAERGGKLIRGTDGEAASRTKWIPIDERGLWQGRPDANVSEVEGKQFIDDALNGKPLPAKGHRFINYLLDVAQEREKQLAALEVEVEKAEDGLSEREYHIVDVLSGKLLSIIGNDRLQAILDRYDGYVVQYGVREWYKSLRFALKNQIAFSIKEARNERQGTGASTGRAGEAIAGEAASDNRTGGQEARAQEDAGTLSLTGQTNAEILAQERANEQAAAEAAREPASPNVTSDQADLFNTQSALFNSNREQTGSAKPFSDVRPYLVSNVFGKEKGEEVPDARFVVGTLPADTIAEIGQFIDGFSDKHALVRISGRTLKHTDEQRHAELDSVIDSLPQIIKGKAEVLHNPTRENSAFIVYESDNNYLVVLEVAKNGNGTDVVNIITTRDRGLKQYRKKSAEWLDGRRSHHPVNPEVPAEGEISAFQPIGESNIPQPADESKPSYIPPKSVEEAKGRWNAGFDGKEFVKSEREQNHVALMRAVSKALDSGLHLNREIDAFVAKELGVTDEQRKVGQDEVDGGAFGYDVYLARKEVEKERASNRSKSLGEKLRLRIGENVGKIKLQDGKIASAATVESLTDTTVTLIGTRGAQKVRITTTYDGLQTYAERAGNDYLTKKVEMASPDGDMFAEPANDTSKEQQATAILDRANVTGKDRLDIMADFRDGKHSLEDLEKAYPGKTANDHLEEKRNIWIPNMTVRKLEKLLSKTQHSTDDIEDLKDFRYFLINDKQSAEEKGFYERYANDGGGILVLKNKFWLTNINSAISAGEQAEQPAEAKPQDDTVDFITATLAKYSAGLNGEGFITKNGKTLSVKAVVKKGRLRFEGLNGDLIFSGVPNAKTVSRFVEDYWKWETDNGVASFQTGSPVIEPLAAKDFDEVIRRMSAGWDAVSRNRIVTIDAYSDIPADILAAAEELGYPTNEIKGFVYQGNAYLVRPNIGTVSEVEEALAHEALGHLGTFAVLGKAAIPVMNEFWLRAGGTAGVLKIARQYGIEKEISAVTDTVMGLEKTALAKKRAAIVNELIAHAQTTGETAKAIKWVLGKIKQALQTFAEQHNWNWLADKLGGFSDLDLAVFMRQAKDAILTGKTPEGTEVSFMVAWHGSPHDHDGFDSSKIGTGEGAQAYGYGHYFASNKEVAEHYRKQLSMSTRELAERAEPYDVYSPEVAVEKLRHAAKNARFNQRNGDAQDYEEVARWIEAGKPENFGGRLYQVELAPEPDEYLDWDKPLSEQSEKVKAALSEHFEDDFGNLTGADIYRKISGGNPKGHNAKMASQWLHDAGIRGIKYLDGSSRDMSGTKWADGVDTSKYDRLAKGVAENYLRDRGDVQGAIRSLREVPAKAGKQYSDAADALESGDLTQDLNYNYVIFSDSDVSIKAKFSRRIHGDVMTVQDYVVPETPEFDGSMSGDLAYTPRSAEANGIKQLPIRMTVGVATDSHRGFGIEHLNAEAQSDNRRMPPNYSDDNAENFARHVTAIAKSFSEIYSEGRHLILRSARMREALVVSEQTDRETGERFYSVVSLRPAEKVVWGDPVWSVGRTALPSDRSLQPGASEPSPEQDAQRSDRQMQRNQTSKFILPQVEADRQPKKAPTVSYKKRRAFTMGEIKQSQSATPVNNPFTLSGLKAAINSAFTHTKDFAGLLEATGKVQFIIRDEIGKYLGDGARFSKGTRRDVGYHAELIAKYAEQTGWKVENTFGSSLSRSQYINLERPTEFDEDGEPIDYDTVKIRVSDHELPPTYKLMNGEADFDVTPDGVFHYDSSGDWVDALIFLSNKAGVEPTGRAKKYVNARKEMYAAEKRAQQERSDMRSHNQSESEKRVLEGVFEKELSVTKSGSGKTYYAITPTGEKMTFTKPEKSGDVYKTDVSFLNKDAYDFTAWPDVKFTDEQLAEFNKLDNEGRARYVYAQAKDKLIESVRRAQERREESHKEKSFDFTKSNTASVNAGSNSEFAPDLRNNSETTLSDTGSQYPDNLQGNPVATTNGASGDSSLANSNSPSSSIQKNLIADSLSQNTDIRYSADGSRILAFVRDGITYFVYDNISQTDDNVKGLAMHEISVHALELGKSDKEFIAIQEQVNVMRKMGDKKVAEAFSTASRALGLDSLLPGKGMAQSIGRYAYSQSDVLRAQAGINKLLDKIEVVLGTPIQGSVESGSGKMSNDGLSTAIKQLSDLLVRHPAISKRLQSVDINIQKDVFSLMRDNIKDFEVFNSIVEFIPVDMMNVLVRGELTSDAALHDMAVFVDLPFASKDNPVATFVNVAGRVAQAMTVAHSARLAASDRSGSFSSSAFADVNNLPARNARNITPGSDRGVPVAGSARLAAELSSSRNGSSTFDTIDNRHDVTPSSDVGLGGVAGETVTLPPIVSRHTFLHEVMGYLVQNHPDLPIVQKLIARFRALLRSIGKALPVMQRMQWFRWADNLTVNDIVLMAQDAMRTAPEALKTAGARGTFKSDGGVEFTGDMTPMQRVASFWKAVASNADAFKYGKVEPHVVDAAEIARQMSTEQMQIAGQQVGNGADFISEEGRIHVFPVGEKRNSEGGFAEYMIQSPGAESAGKLSGGGSLLYQAAQKWIYANGGRFVKDGKLTEINKLRVTSNMLSSALRENSADHLDPDPDQSIVGWKEGDTENNIAALAIREMELSHERIPELNKLSYDFGAARIVDEAGKVVQPFQIREILQRVDPQFAQGIGVATAARAVATRAALRGEGLAGVGGRGALLQSGVAFGDNASPVLYSKRQQPAQPPRQNKPGTPSGKSIQDAIDAGRPLGHLLSMFDRNQIVQLYGEEMPELHDYKRAQDQIVADRNRLMYDADDMLNTLRNLSPQARDQFASIAHEATIEGFDPSQEYSEPDKIKELARLIKGLEQRRKESGLTEKQEKLLASSKKLIEANPGKHAELRRRFLAMPKDAREAFTALRDKYRDTTTLMFKELEARIERLSVGEEAKRNAIADLRMEYDRVKNSIYFPLARFGDHVVIGVKDGSKQVEYYESEKKAKEAAARMMKDGYQTRRTTRKAYSETLAKEQAISNIVDSVKGLRDTRQADAFAFDQLDALLDNINQAIIQMVPDGSYRRHFAHRKNTPGYSADFIRAYADSMWKVSNHISNLRHSDAVSGSIKAMQERVDNAGWKGGDVSALQDVVNHIIRREEELQKPTSPVAATIAQGGFLAALASASNFFVNLTQTPVLTFPWLGGRYGYSKAAMQFSRALATQMASFKKANSLREIGHAVDMRNKLKGDELAIFERLHATGKVDVTQAHDLIDAANNDTPINPDSPWNTAMRVGALPQHLSEVFNRQISALVAIRLELAKSGDKEAAFEAAVQAIDNTHFDYEKANRPMMMHGNWQRVVFMFKQYAQKAAYLWARTAWLAMKGQGVEKSVARKQLAGMVGMQFAVAGVLGMPIFLEAAVVAGGVAGFRMAGKAGAYTGVGLVILAAIAAAMGDDDEDDFDTDVRNWLAENAGKEWGEVLARGAVRMTGIDIASRVNADEFFIRKPDSSVEGKDYYTRWVEAGGGFVLGYGGNVALGLSMMGEGKVYRGLEKMIPVKQVRDVMTAIRFEREGATNLSGENLLKGSNPDSPTLWEKTVKAVGFQPARIAEVYEANASVKNAERILNTWRQDLLDRRWEAISAKDQDEVRRIDEKIKEFNDEHPTHRITGETKIRSIMSHRKAEKQSDHGIRMSRQHKELSDKAAYANR